MRVRVNTDRCIGAGSCLVAPDVFDQNEDDGLVVVLQERPAPEHHGVVREAAKLCPADVIHIEEV